MLKFGNKEFRNLQEQVEENMKNIQDLMQGVVVLDEFGIKVIGQEASVEDMPTVEEYKEEHEDWSYGDAYAIGTETPYSLYILTRGNSNNPDDYWFDIGVFPMPGPRGLQGETGDTGPQGQTGPQGEPGRDGVDGDDALCYDLIWTSNSNPSGGTVLTMAQPTSIRWNRTAKVGDVFLLPWKVNNSNETYLCQMEITEIQAETNYVIAELQNYTQINPVYLTWGNILGTLNNQTDLKNALDGKQAKLTFDSTPTEASSNPVTSNGIYVALGRKQNTLTFDDYPTAGSNNPVKSWGIRQVFEGKQDKLTSTGLPTYTLDKVVGFDSQGNLGIASASSNVVDWSDIQNKPTFSTVATTGDYDDLSDKPDLSIYVQSGTLSPVAFNGDYRDLNHTPSLGTASSYNATDTVEGGSNNLVTSGGVYTAIQNITPFTQVQSNWTETDNTKVDYIKNKPTIPSTPSDIGAEPAFTDGTAQVYSIANNQPDIITLNKFVGQSGGAIETDSTTTISLSKVAKTGDYDDLTNKPTIPAAQVNADWNASSGVAEILNKPTLFSGDYNDLTNKPSIPTKTSDLTNDSGYITSSDIPSIPTKTSDLTNDSGFITSSALSGYATEQWVGNQGYLTSVSWNDVSNKPTFSTVATSGDYDDLLNKPTLFDGDYDSLTNKPDLSVYAESSDLSSVAFSGDYEDLSNKPTIPTVDYPVTDVQVDGVSVVSNKVASITMPTVPTKVSDLQNDSGYITGITSSDVTTALGYTPYSDANPNGYTSNVGTVTSVNNTQPDANGNVAITIPDTTNMVTTNTTQTISGNKTFSGNVSFSNTTDPVSSIVGYKTGDAITNIYTTYGKNSIVHTSLGNSYTYSLPSSTGTLALTSDIPTVPTNVSSFTNDAGYLTSSTGVTSVNGSSGAITNIATLSDIPDAVSGTNDGTNWTSLTIGSDTYSIPSGGVTPSNMVTTDTNQTITGIKNFTGLETSNLHIRTISAGTTLGVIGPNNGGTSMVIKSSESSTYGIVPPTTSSYSADKTIATTDDLPTIDQTYSASSTNAQSGVAVASGISSAISGQSHEVWTFTLANGTTVTKDVVLH